MASDRVVRVSLTAQVSNYVAGMEQARKATERSGKSAEDAKARYEEQNRAMESVGRGLVVAGALAVTASVLAAKAAISWESAWAGVTKTVEGTPEQLAEVEAGLRSLAKSLPAAHDEIAAVAEAAGQLGIQTGSVVAFTKTMIDLGETTNLSADQAATSLARFMNVMGTSQDKVSNLGSAVVELGNNYATTEAEIVEMSMRLSGAGRQIGLSEGEVLGLATALSSVGIEAEAGGSAISKVMIDIASSVDKGGERVGRFAEISGVSADVFTKKWKTDPGAALALFVKGLADAESQGGSTLGILEELGITEVRMRDALLRSAAASDQFTTAMDTGNEAFVENNALAEEAAKRYATVESKLEVMRNKVVDASIDFGQVFLPVVSAMADALGGLADGFSALPAPVKGTVAVVGALAGVTALAGGAFLLAIPKIAQFQLSLSILATSQIPAVAGAAVKMQGAIAASSVAMGKAAAFMTGPWGLALAAAAVGVALLTKYVDDLKASSEEYQNVITNAKTADDLFKVADKGRLISELDKATASAEVFQEKLDKIATSDFATGLDLSAQQLKKSLKDLGGELATTAQSDLPSAQKAFRLLADEMGLSADQQVQLLDEMPAYKEALVAQATELGINVTSTDEAANSTALLKLAFGNATPTALDAADAYLAAADESAGLDDKLSKLIDTINKANGVGQDAVSANADYQKALADTGTEIDALIEKNGIQANALDETTLAGSANAAMLADLAGRSQAAAKAALDAGGTAEDYSKALDAGRQSIYDTALAITGNADAAQKLTDKIYAVPSAHETRLTVEKSQAERALRDFAASLSAFKSSNMTLTAYVREVGGRAEGGAIRGPGGPRDDKAGLFRLSDGEHVLDSEDVNRMGGQQAVYRFRESLYRGYADGGAIGYVQPTYVQSPQYAGGGSISSAQLPDIYVQNPFTGEYLLARVDGRIATADHGNTITDSMGKQVR